MRNAYWVEPGRLLAGAYPRPETVPVLADAGITAFVDLTQPDELDPYDGLIGDAVHHRMPVGDFGVPTAAEMTRTLDLIDGLLADGHGVYVHCWAGRHRVGTIAALYRIRVQGWPPEKAWQEQEAYGFGSPSQHPELYGYVYGSPGDSRSAKKHGDKHHGDAPLF